MNVQISPLNTPPVRGTGPEDDAPGGRGRIVLIGGVALAVVLNLRRLRRHLAAAH